MSVGSMNRAYGNVKGHKKQRTSKNSRHYKGKSGILLVTKDRG
jgi:hypothetical protein